MKELKLILLMLTLGVMLFSCQEEEIDEIQLNIPAGETYLSASVRSPGKSCLKAFEGRCLGGEAFIVGTFEILEPLDTINYCNQKITEGKLTCSFNECTDRLDILYSFKAPQPKGDRCVSQKWM